ncbi:DNA repair protein [Pseudomonas hunanensis]|uniref:DNA repair protein n=1 Tax=Pseudomonas hunanensis TaxID=1247546 RepID=A0ABD6MW39_9PSED|nr:DNA repair protein RadC [Pseudomonas hunanensis]ALG88785.1 DNA repair protein RadC [uncultured bacterium]NWL45449.1 DNA repair protein [Pseudomonas hunanensis]
MLNLSDYERNIVDQAKTILMHHLAKPGVCLESPEAVRRYLELEIAGEQNECFCVLFLDAKHRVLTFKRLFQGSISSASVYTRVIVQEALQCNAAAMICAHNHPSGDPEPSQDDRVVTDRVRDALKLIDVRLLDHFVIGHGKYASFAERGLL